MNCMTGITGMNPSFVKADHAFVEKHDISEAQIKEQKEKFMKELTNSSGNADIYALSEFIELLQTLSFEQLEKLSEVKSIFNSNCYISFRSEIVKILLSVGSDQWKAISTQINSLMPLDASGNQIIAITRIFTSIKDITFRCRLTRLGNRLIEYDMPSEGRLDVLMYLAKLNAKDLLQMDSVGEEFRSAFRKKIESSKSKL
ncbi:MAG: hypothetical protein H0W50_10155 [Parachlamydiaceae bacterium]|nr:hypothetical protein [Parachlamydiaceae bacterium]